MRVHKVNGTCWRCGYVFDSTTAADGTDTAPFVGAVVVCIDCGALGLYGDSPAGIVVRQPTDDELADLLADPGVVRVVTAYMDMRARGDKP